MDKLILRDDHDLLQIANISTEDQRKEMRLASDPLRLATSDQYVPRLEVEKKSVKTNIHPKTYGSIKVRQVETA